MESDLLGVLARLLSVIERIVVLARLRRQPVTVMLVYVLLDALCHAMGAIERSLRDDAE